MNATRLRYFDAIPLKKDTRTLLVLLGFLLAAGGVLVLQSFVYASSLRQLWEAGRNLWGKSLGMMLQILAIWAVVLGVVFAVRNATQPVIKYGTEFWEALITGFPLGLVLPFLLALGGGLCLYLPLGVLSLLVVELFPYATLQFAWLAAAYLVFFWILAGMLPLLASLFRQGKWYYKFMAILLFFLLALDLQQSLLELLEILVREGAWQTDNTALLAALIGTLLVSIAAVLWSLRGRPGLTIIYAITGIYIASVSTGSFSERLFGWGEAPAALLALLSPLLYLQVVKWILRRDGTAAAGLAAGFVGLLAGLLAVQLLQLRITGQGWVSLLWGITVVLGVGLALGYFLGRRLTKWMAARWKLEPLLIRFLDTGLTAGIMAGMLLGGLLAR